MGSIYFKTIHGRKRLFTSCGGCIKPKFQKLNYRIVEYNEKIEFNALEDQDFLDFLAKKPKCNHLMIIDKNIKGVKDYLKSFLIGIIAIDGVTKRQIKEFNRFYLVYDHYNSYTMKRITSGLKSDCIYW